MASKVRDFESQLTVALSSAFKDAMFTAVTLIGRPLVDSLPRPRPIRKASSRNEKEPRSGTKFIFQAVSRPRQVAGAAEYTAGTRGGGREVRSGNPGARGAHESPF